MIGIGKLQRPERRCRSYRDVAQPRRQRKNTWQDAKRIGDQEDESTDPPGMSEG